jgi:hypothetical protein
VEANVEAELMDFERGKDKEAPPLKQNVQYAKF